MLVAMSTTAQSPQQMNYQAEVRNSSGTAITNTPVNFALLFTMVQLPALRFTVKLVTYLPISLD